MIIREQHVRIEAELSQVNADRRRSFDPEEIDIAVNTSIGEFVSKRSKQYARGDLQSVEDIVSLMVIDKPLQAYITGTSKYLCILPADFKELCGVRFTGRRLCGQPAPAPKTGTLATWSLSLPRTARTAPPYYQEYKLVRDGVIVFDITQTPGWAGLTDKDGYFTLQNQLELYGMWSGVSRGAYGFEAHPKKLYSDKPFSVVVDAASVTAANAPRSVTYHTGLGQTIYAEPVSPIRVNELLGTPFWKPDPARIIYHEAEKQSLVIYTPPDVILDSAIMTYIRKPAITNVILGIDCDLPDNNKVHELICKMAVRYLMGDTGDERYPLKLSEETRNANNNRVT